MFYRLVWRSNGQPYINGSHGLRNGEAEIAERVPDGQAVQRGAEQADGWPAPGWVWGGPYDTEDTP